MSLKFNPTLKTIRFLISELRKVSTAKKLREHNLVTYLFSQARRFQVTELQECRAKDEMKFLLDSYANYLHSQRKYGELLKIYGQNGERTVTDTASMLGFKLPQDPK
ncbi:protein FMC1 homolog [Cimex lectularius]|uniref:Protein FMC1 homolog n=1 Tax=Cimex lectularius TaxID=79782 RepID=A0A8I6RGL5_CIMLE|nr:protein FMC1 homolog [Cimex lectularius]